MLKTPSFIRLCWVEGRDEASECVRRGAADKGSVRVYAGHLRVDYCGVRLDRDEIGRPSPRVVSVVIYCVGLARTILERVGR